MVNKSLKVPEEYVLPVQPKTPPVTEPQKTQNSQPLTFDQLIALQQQEGAADREARANGENFVRYGGGYSNTEQEGSVQLEKPMYDDLYYYNPGEKRYIQEGTASADENFMSREDYALVQNYKKQWADANARGDAAAAQMAHAAAEAIRAKYGYSGDTKTRTDGGGYTTLQKQTTQPAQPSSGAPAGGMSGSGAGDLTSLLEEWKKAAAEQANGQIDYAVAQAITQLERALEDSKAQYKEQAESVARDEMQALDNSALYAEMRGDKGGIGQSQYNEIQSAAAQNRLTVQQAQTKLATDTARQIADLRAQGEFEKADKLLEITQTYLSQLINLEQWAAEFGLSRAQFEASLEQWQAEYDMAMKEFDYNVATNERGYTASMAEALMAAGVPLDDAQLKALGWSRDQYNEYLRQQELKKAAGVGSEKITSLSDLYTALRDAGITSDADAATQAKLWGYTGSVGDYAAWLKANPAQGGGTGGGMTLANLSAAARQAAAVLSDPMFSNGPDGAAAYIEKLWKVDETISEDEAGYLLSMIGY